jgi:Tol biopolymer transport system component
MSLRVPIVVLSIVLLALALPAYGEYKPDPTWKIAFVRDNNLWVMNADGTAPRPIFKGENVSGKVSWSNDGQRIAFSRQGEVTIKYPDGGGGGHKCYDIFVAHIDSVQREFWWFITDDLGSAYAEWSADDQLFVYHHDVAAAKANSVMPEYRIWYRNWNGTVARCLAPDNAGPGEYLGIQPTMSPDKQTVAYIHLSKGQKATEVRNIGMVIVPRTGITRTQAELEIEATKFAGAGSPAFSPDGKTIAYIHNEDNCIYLVSPDTREKRKIFTPTAGFQPRPNAISWSPDGAWLAFSNYDGNIHVVDTTGQGLKQISFGGNDYFPAFSK